MLVTIGSVLVAAACILHPEESLRPLATDRPTLTFSPTSVDAGHLQLETDILLGSYDGTTGAVAVGGSTLRLGVTSQTDLQVTFPTLAVSSSDLFSGSQSPSISRGGFALRLKWNLVGNDGGGFALGVVPVLAIDGEDTLSASLIVPASVSLPADFSLGAMFEADVIKPGDVVDGRGLVSVVMSHPIGLGWTGYFESQADVRTNVAAGDELAVNLIGSAGIAWILTDNLQLDGGIRVPLVGIAPTAEAFVGVSLRR